MSQRSSQQNAEPFQQILAHLRDNFNDDAQRIDFLRRRNVGDDRINSILAHVHQSAGPRGRFPAGFGGFAAAHQAAQRPRLPTHQVGRGPQVPPSTLVRQRAPNGQSPPPVQSRGFITAEYAQFPPQPHAGPSMAQPIASLLPRTQQGSNPAAQSLLLDGRFQVGVSRVQSPAGPSAAYAAEMAAAEMQQRRQQSTALRSETAAPIVPEQAMQPLPSTAGPSSMHMQSPAVSYWPNLPPAGTCDPRQLGTPTLHNTIDPRLMGLQEQPLDSAGKVGSASTTPTSVGIPFTGSMPLMPSVFAAGPANAYPQAMAPVGPSPAPTPSPAPPTVSSQAPTPASAASASVVVSNTQAPAQALSTHSSSPVKAFPSSGLALPQIPPPSVPVSTEAPAPSLPTPPGASAKPTRPSSRLALPNLDLAKSHASPSPSQSPTSATVSTPGTEAAASTVSRPGGPSGSAASEASTAAGSNNNKGRGRAGSKLPKEPLAPNLQAIVDASEPDKQKRIEEAFRSCHKGAVLLDGDDACVQCRNDNYPCHAKTNRETKEDLPDGKTRYQNCNMCVVRKLGQSACSLYKEHQARRNTKPPTPVFGGVKSIPSSSAEKPVAGVKRKTPEWLKPSQQQMAVQNASNFSVKRPKLAASGHTNGVTTGTSTPNTPSYMTGSLPPMPLSAGSQSSFSPVAPTPALSGTGSRDSPLTVVEEGDEDEDEDGDMEEVEVPAVLNGNRVAGQVPHGPVEAGFKAPQEEDEEEDDDEMDMEEVPIPFASPQQSGNQGDEDEVDDFATLLEERLGADEDTLANALVDQLDADEEDDEDDQPRQQAQVAAADEASVGMKRPAGDEELVGGEENLAPPKKKRKRALKNAPRRKKRDPTPRELALRAVETGELLPGLDAQIDGAYETYRRVPFVIRQMKRKRDMYYSPKFKCIRCTENNKLCAYTIPRLAGVEFHEGEEWVVLPGCEACASARVSCDFQHDSGVLYGKRGSLMARVLERVGSPREPRPSGDMAQIFHIS